MNYTTILKNGSFFYPANKHYSFTGSVTCDKCKSSNIQACVGYSTFDLCMNCVDRLTKNNVPTPPKEKTTGFMTTNMMQNMYSSNNNKIPRIGPPMVTKMMQNMYDK